jgi:hypothetical protein
MPGFSSINLCSFLTARIPMESPSSLSRCLL